MKQEERKFLVVILICHPQQLVSISLEEGHFLLANQATFRLTAFL
jgi:hypothetical protein